MLGAAYDDALECYRVRAEITDASSAYVTVDVTSVTLADVALIGPNEWHDPKSRMESGFETCHKGTRVGVDFKATFLWWNRDNDTVGSEERRGSATFTCT
ncbi:hypothetical protein Asi02nite_45380 [Asanoa siamensis]|uniref:Uncharacterized protein n=1 Tax=Asanoa siamensis TaxID=926357 RepID=A0ABQ4CUP7_9ACTN|nr:hypothetical protein Asi02nite_45380 [Asanoa siamensis]